MRRVGDGQVRDRGSMLVLAMLLVVIGGMMIFPLLDYGTGLIRQSRVAHNKVARVEAVKGGLRMALADPMQLYRICGGTNVAAPVSLSNQGISIPVATSCAQVAQASAEDSGRYANAIVGAGVPLAPELSRLYPGSASSDIGRWVNDTTTLPTPGKVWLPDLPVHDLSTRQGTGWTMPSEYGACTVFFPGTYTAPLTLDQNRSYYFTSGVYYFTNIVTIKNPAQVVVGSGSAKGCASDQEAAFDANGAPTTHAITGAGATFVFGHGGRLNVATTLNATGLSLRFNQRYVDPTDLNSLPSAGVSIMTVNGAINAAGDYEAYTVTGAVQVPRSMVGGANRRPATEQAYTPSLVLPTWTSTLGTYTLLNFTPVIDVQVSHNVKVTVSIPGYVAVPQGRVNVVLTDQAAAHAGCFTGAGAVKPTDWKDPQGLSDCHSADILFEGGVLATSVTVGNPRPRTLRFDIVLPVVQRMFKITTATTSGLPKVTSNALVQVNQNGAFAVNSWAIG